MTSFEVAVGSRTLAAARRTVERGWSPVPVPARSKIPLLAGWQNLRLTEDDLAAYFREGDNLGVHFGEPSGWTVDVDCDIPEAVAAADALLPFTAAVYGRPGNPRSHRLYRIDPPLETQKWTDSTRKDGEAMVLELRATGAQSLVPPSVHPSGETYAWDADGEPLHVDGRVLKATLAKVAAAALLARHWPVGARHEAALALAGALLRHAWDPDDAREFVAAVASAAGDAETRDRVLTVEYTARRLGVGEPATGLPTLKELIDHRVVDRAVAWLGLRPAAARDGEGGRPDDDAGEKRRSQADRLVAYALADCRDTLLVDQCGQPHALVGGVPLRLAGGATRARSWLRKLLWDNEQRGANGETLATAIGVLAAKAEFSGVTHALHVRSAWHRDALYVELGPGRVYRIDADGWGPDPSPPVLFRQFANARPLPDPEAGGSVDDLLQLLNLARPRDRRLFVAYVVLGLMGHLARPILQATGAHGAGKTTLCRVVKRLLDPGAPESARLDARDALQKASHCQVFMVDNLNGLPDWAVDVVCRLVTGEADSKRQLYSDDDDVVYELQRLVLLNGINPPADRADFQDRVLPIESERIPDARRRTEAEIWATFERERGRWLGAIFELLSRAIEREPTLELAELPRLADWGRYAAAVYVVRGDTAATFRQDWREAVGDQQRVAVEGSLVAQMIQRLMTGRDSWEGSPTDLHGILSQLAEQSRIDVRRERTWPKSPTWLWRRMREVLPALTALGIAAERREEEDGSRITLRRDAPDGDPAHAASAASAASARWGGAGGTSEESNAAASHEPPAASAARRQRDRAGGTGGTGGISGSFSAPTGVADRVHHGEPRAGSERPDDSAEREVMEWTR